MSEPESKICNWCGNTSYTYEVYCYVCEAPLVPKLKAHPNTGKVLMTEWEYYAGQRSAIAETLKNNGDYRDRYPDEAPVGPYAPLIDDLDLERYL